MASKPLLHFEISERKILLRILDPFWVLLSIYFVGLIFNFSYFKITSDTWPWLLVMTFYLIFFASIFELYDLQKASKFESILKNVILTSSTTVLFFILTPFFTPSLPENRLQILFFFLSTLIPLLAWRWAYINFISSPRFFKRVLVVGGTFDIQRISSSLQKSDPNYVVVGYIHTDTQQRTSEITKSEGLIHFEVEELATAIKQHHINEVLVAGAYQKGLMLPLYNQLNELLKFGFPVRDYAQVYEEVTYRIPVEQVDKDFYRYFPFSRNHQNKFYISFFRLFDVIVSLIGILLGILVAPFILMGNLLANRGTFFYLQDRVGKNGKIFQILKLRTMRKDAEYTGPQYASKNDLRVTKFGKFLRRSRIDEVPQFYNVLKGEMSLIGPRPERPVFVEELSRRIPFYETRHIIKPGLTGWAQVKAEYGSDEAGSLEKLQYDLFYIKHRGLFIDINILLKTLSTMIFLRGQ